MLPPPKENPIRAARVLHGDRRWRAKQSLIRQLRAGICPLLLAASACSLPLMPGEMLHGMVRVPKGSFEMGITRARPDDEGPAHWVFLGDFWIDRYPVTNAQYRLCVEADGCLEPQDLRYYQDPDLSNHPVVFITWYEARDYCHWAGKRLPTEAEWEKAARGNSGRRYPWGNQLYRDRLNADNRIGHTTAVGSYPLGASPYGALDMAGNVWEWTADWYEPYPGSAFSSELYGEKYKIVRGGSWNHSAKDARSDHRDFAHPSRSLAVVGFRCALSAGRAKIPYYGYR